MDIWGILGIEPSKDKKIIKKAYHAQLKNTHPEDNPEAFMHLREAYETALKSATDTTYYHSAHSQDNDNYMNENEYKNDKTPKSENNIAFDYFKYTKDNNNYMEKEYENVEEAYLVHKDKKEQTFQKWWHKVEELYNDYEKRMDTENWMALLYEDIPYQMEFYERCRQQIYYAFINSNSYSLYLSKDVRMLIDSFFSYSGTPLERSRKRNAEEFRQLNKKLKLCENIEFDKIVTNGASAYHIDSFLRQYENFLTALTEYHTEDSSLEDSMQRLKSMQVFYLPVECIDTALHFKEYSKEQMEDRIKELEEMCKNTVEVKLLQAQYSIYSGQTESAKEQLMKLYREVPVKNYVVIYQMAECCKKVFMYYEAYMLVKMLTWLNPKPFMHDMAEDIFEVMEGIYIKKKKEGAEISDIEHIHMCRMYLRSNREGDAIKALKEVKDAKEHLWEYEMAHCLCVFYEEAKDVTCNLYVEYAENKPRPVMEIEQAVPLMELLKNYPKNLLNDIEKLEWEELLGRCLFEQRKYEECVSHCNKLLEEYPVSYPILLLRAYGDYGRYCLGPQYTMKDYGDCNFLILALPDRIEARLIAASAMMFCHKYSLAENILEPVKKKVPDHLTYYNFRKYKEDKSKKYKEGLMKLFHKVKNVQLDIPPVSKYRLLNLHNIFVEACEFGGMHIDDEEEKNTFFSFLDGILKSNYNHPEKFVDFFWLYFRSIRREEALKIVCKQLKTAKAEWEKQQLYGYLSDIYWAMGRLEEAEKINLLRTEDDRLNIYASMGRKYQEAGEYEKAVRLITEAKSVCAVNIKNYAALGKAYDGMGEKENAIKAFLDGIKICKKSGDYNTNDNLYYDLYRIYQKDKEWDKAIEILNEMKKHTNSGYFKNHYYYRLGYVYWRRSVYDGETDENDKVFDLWTKAIEKDVKFVDMYGRLAWMYKDLGQTDKAIELIWKGIERCGSCGDYLTDGNLYHDLYWFYRDEQMWEEAIGAAGLMNEHTKLDIIKADYPCFLAYSAMHTQDYETAYKNFMMVKKNSQYRNYQSDIDADILICCYGMGDYKKTCSMALDMAYGSKKEKDSRILPAFHMLAFHSRFMLKCTVDRKLAKKIIKEIKKLITKAEDMRKFIATDCSSSVMAIKIYKKEKGLYLLELAELYTALEKIKLAVSYKEQGLKLLSETEGDYSKDIATMNAWCFAYRKEFKKAAQYYKDTPGLITPESTSSISYRYFVKMSNSPAI